MTKAIIARFGIRNNWALHRLEISHSIEIRATTAMERSYKNARANDLRIWVTHPHFESALLHNDERARFGGLVDDTARESTYAG